MKTKGMLSLLLAIAMVLTLFTACGSGIYSAANDASGEVGWYDYSNMSESEAPESVSTESSGSSSNTLPENMKWIRTVRIDAETRDMDTLLENIQNQVNALGGYIESRTVYHGSMNASYNNRSANLVIRIPVDRTDEFLVQVVQNANVTSSNEELENITLTYVATESRMNALQAEETRLLELMAQAQDMSDLLEIEDRLTDVRAELESVTSQLRRYDNLVDYSTVHLSIEEVVLLTPVAETGFFQRIASGFMDSLNGLWHFLQELVIWLATNLPYLVLIAAVTALLVVLLRRRARKRRAYRQQPPPFPAEGTETK